MADRPLLPDLDRAVYLDHAATTPLDPRVAQVLADSARDLFGNPSSLHGPGRRAREAIDGARAQVARLVGSEPDEVVFTASGTEADNLALLGVMAALGPGSHHVITSVIEHPAVLAPLAFLERQGVRVTRLSPGADGVIDPDALARAFTPQTRLVSVMSANNVTGVIQPLADLAALTRDHGALFHTDAVQAVGKIPLDLGTVKVDLLSLSGHKLHGPKGVGALIIRRGVKVHPLVLGGGQERGLRSATENTPGLVALGAAAEIAREEGAGEAVRLVALRERLLDGLSAAVPTVYVIGDRWRRLPGHLCVGFAGQEGEAIRVLLALDEAGIAASSGSACSAHRAAEPSAVLTAMGFDPIRARGALRLTLGRFTTDADIDRLLAVLPGIVRALRPLTSHA
ncbi:cysteine desulfurase family protein [Pararhodospirillum oryzae]|uniref:Cysteine desulfurase n=1 Tax=Pararhodospirillum oryzae TaxID=478448 RepID=A0A512HB08_9PROT|nr:cysteine desulfurase family protein [Pararhodospirillum oryzae]GEO82629.1 cysteine desulfurase [Pararhodospirillum oryzae]